MDDEDFQPRLQAGEQCLQPVELRLVDAAAGVPRPAIAGRRIDADQPGMANALCEGIAMSPMRCPFCHGAKWRIELADTSAAGVQ